jgi:hypothetical protein
VALALPDPGQPGAGLERRPICRSGSIWCETSSGRNTLPGLIVPYGEQGENLTFSAK